AATRRAWFVGPAGIVAGFGCRSAAYGSGDAGNVVAAVLVARLALVLSGPAAYGMVTARLVHSCGGLGRGPVEYPDPCCGNQFSLAAPRYCLAGGRGPRPSQSRPMGQCDDLCAAAGAANRISLRVERAVFAARPVRQSARRDLGAGAVRLSLC